MKVTLWKCERCSLLWVDEEEPEYCPACLRRFSGTTTIKLAGQDVEVSRMRTFDARKTPQNLDRIDLGTRCPHNYLHPSLCGFCVQRKIEM